MKFTALNLSLRLVLDLNFINKKNLSIRKFARLVEKLRKSKCRMVKFCLAALHLVQTGLLPFAGLREWVSTWIV